MTDARLPGPWLSRLAWMRLSDRAVRTLAQSLMWSNEAGTDGDLPADCHHFLYPAGVDDATAEELIAHGWWVRAGTGYRIPDWTGTAGQESAKQVSTRRANNRRRQREHRDRTRDVTRDVSSDEGRYPVGQDRQGQAVTEPELKPTSAALRQCESSGCGLMFRARRGRKFCERHQDEDQDVLPPRHQGAGIASVSEDECVPPGECRRASGFGSPPCPRHRQAVPALTPNGNATRQA